MKQPSAILTSDIHIQSKNPVCRKDDYLEALGYKLKWVSNLQRQYNCPILDAGDLLNSWKIDPELEQWCIKNIPKEFRTIIGNHDMPSHNISLFRKGSLSLLNTVRSIQLLSNGVEFKGFNVTGLHYGQELEYTPTGNVNVLVSHEMVCKEKQKHDHFTYSTAKTLLKKYSKFNLVVTGHSHESFEVEYQGRKLVNVGSLMRRDINQKDYQPRVALWYAEDNRIEWIDVPITDFVISTKHKDVIKLRDERIDSFVDKLKDSENIGISFEDNLEKHFEINNTDEVYKKKIYNSMEIKGDR